MAYNILSIDGGGIRGIIPCTVLCEIEKRTNKPICELFDLMAGTSTGGLLALGVNVPENGRAKYSAQDLLEIYQNQGDKIFPQKWSNVLKGVFDQKYNHRGLEELLEAYFGDADLKGVLKEVLVTSYETYTRKPFYFLSRLAKINEHENFLLKEIARSTSAAPTYFEPAKVKEAFSMIDGGVFANNPSVLALCEAKEASKTVSIEPSAAMEKGMGAIIAYGTPLEEYFMLSLGTGMVKKSYPYEQAKSWGQVEWLLPLIDILMQGVSESVHYEMLHLLQDNNGRRDYFRLNPIIKDDLSDMSDVSKQNIEGLTATAKSLIIEKDKEIDEICHRLSE